MSGIALTLLVYLTQLLAGTLLLRAIDGALRQRRVHERLARALLLGPAALAVQMLLMDAAGLRFTLPLVLLPWWLAGVAALVLRRRTLGTGGASIANGASDTIVADGADGADARGGAGARRAVLALAAALFLVALAQGLLLPVYTSDAMHNFALVARVFETHGHIAQQAAAALHLTDHTDYPPLVALNEAVLFLAAGDARALAIKPFFALADLALLLLVVEACFRALPARRAACVAAFALLSPFLGMQAMEGYADVRLTASILLLALQGIELWRAPTARALLLFGACTATCALTKFEGLALALAAAPLPLLVAARAARLRRAARSPGAARSSGDARSAGTDARPAPLWRAAFAASGLALSVSLAWPAHLAVQGAGTVPLVGPEWHDLPRAAQRAPGAANGLIALMLVHDGNGNPAWGLFWPVVGALAGCGLLLRSRRRAVGCWLALFAAHLLLYVVVLALSPHELDWHVGTAGPRLILHLAPWALLAAIAALAAPRGAMPLPDTSRTEPG